MGRGRQFVHHLLHQVAQPDVAPLQVAVVGLGEAEEVIHELEHPARAALDAAAQLAPVDVGGGLVLLQELAQGQHVLQWAAQVVRHRVGEGAQVLQRLQQLTGAHGHAAVQVAVELAEPLLLGTPVGDVLDDDLEAPVSVIGLPQVAHREQAVDGVDGAVPKGEVAVADRASPHSPAQCGAQGGRVGEQVVEAPCQQRRTVQAHQALRARIGIVDAPGLIEDHDGVARGGEDLFVPPQQPVAVHPKAEHLVGLLDAQQQVARIPGLGDIGIDAALVHRVDHGLDVGVTGEQHPDGVRVPLLDLREDVHPGHLGHPMVADHHGDRGALQDLQGLLGGGGGEDLQVPAEVGAEGDQVAFLIVQVQDLDAFLVHGFKRVAPGARAAGGAGVGAG